MSAHKTNTRITIILSTILGLAITAFVLLNVLKVGEPETPLPTVKPLPTTENTETTPAPTPSILKESRPLLEAYPEAPEATTGVSTTKVNKNIIVTTEKNKITLGKTTLTPPTKPCTVNEPVEFCLAAKAKTNDIQYEVYYLKDAAHSRLFENPENFATTTINTAPAAATLDIKLGEKTSPTIIIVNKNSTGWMLTLPENTKPETILQHITTE